MGTDLSMNDFFDEETRASISTFSEDLPLERSTRAGTRPHEEKRDVVSCVAYLIGVAERFFHPSIQMFYHDVYERLEKEHGARIVRNLCMLRTKLEQNYRAINTAMWSDLRNLNSLPDLVPMECLDALSEEGVQLIQANRKLSDYLVDIHKLLLQHIHRCKDIFPEWVEWGYIRSLFIIPGAQTVEGNAAAVQRYYGQIDLYPYQAYINWSPRPNEGNILYNDRKFLTLLYERNRDQFTDVSKVTEAGSAAIGDLGEFFKDAKSAIVAVDCENADPCKVIGALREVERMGLLDKIAKILLVDDEHTSSQWDALRRNPKLPIEYHLTRRIKPDKSMVDVALAVKTSQELARSAGEVDSAVIVSSDCDFWSLIEMTPDIRFLILIEYQNCSQAYYDQLKGQDIPFYYIDEFYPVGSKELKNEVVLDAVVKNIKERYLKVDMDEIVSSVLSRTGIEMTDDERDQFYERHISTMKIVFGKDGSPVLQMDGVE